MRNFFSDFEVGSTSNNHTSGRAVDIQCETSEHRRIMVRALILGGMTGIGIGKAFLHCDTNHTTAMMWLY